MLHLSFDRLAELADAEPTPHEAEHLSACAACARERAATRSLLMMARAEREQLGMPLTRWDSLAPELHRAGLVTAGALMSAPRGSAADVDTTARSRRVGHVVRWLQAAAVLVLIGGGAAVGRMSAGESPLWWASARGPGELPPPVAREPLPPLRPLPGIGDAGPASTDALLPEFKSVTEALVALRRYEVAYQHAAAYLADQDSTARLDEPAAVRTRLVALDRAGRAMGEALREAPYDPVINVYYLTTLGQRQATLRELDMALPDGQRIRSF
jgi:hypothetical protein